MDKGLLGKRVAIGGTRKVDEISTLIKKQGGIPLERPLQGTVFLAEKEVKPDLTQFIHTGADWIILTTGIGLDTLVNMAEKLNLKDLFLKRLSEANIASRGYKTVAALKNLGMQPDASSDDGTSKGLIRALESVDFSRSKVMIQLHGETAPELTSFFEKKGAEVYKILPYQHIAPDPDTVGRLCDELLSGQCDAVCFTTAVQVRSLFDYAREKGCFSDMVHCFMNNAAAASVGKVTAEALREEGVERIIVPENERMGAMIIELARYFQKKI